MIKYSPNNGHVLKNLFMDNYQPEIERAQLSGIPLFVRLYAMTSTRFKKKILIKGPIENVRYISHQCSIYFLRF